MICMHACVLARISDLFFTCIMCSYMHVICFYKHTCAYMSDMHACLHDIRTCMCACYACMIDNMMKCVLICVHASLHVCLYV